jgi:hypothetical protein
MTLRRWLRNRRWVALLWGRFLDLPVTIVLAVIWLLGVALLGSLVLVLYLVGMDLIRALGMF